MEIKDFIEVFADCFDDTEASEIKADTSFRDLDEWSSLVGMSVIAMAKLSYNATITGTELKTCNTVQDVFNLIVSKQ